MYDVGTLEKSLVLSIPIQFIRQAPTYSKWKRVIEFKMQFQTAVLTFSITAFEYSISFFDNTTITKIIWFKI